jgi:hypothetical protein
MHGQELNIKACVLHLTWFDPIIFLLLQENVAGCDQQPCSSGGAVRKRDKLSHMHCLRDLEIRGFSGVDIEMDLISLLVGRMLEEYVYAYYDAVAIESFRGSVLDGVLIFQPLNFWGQNGSSLAKKNNNWTSLSWDGPQARKLLGPTCYSHMGKFLKWSWGSSRLRYDMSFLPLVYVVCLIIFWWKLKVVITSYRR